MITKEQALDLIRHTREHHTYMRQMDEQISLCGWCHIHPEIHIFRLAEFRELAAVLGTTPTLRPRDDESYPYIYEIMVDDVSIFCLATSREVVENANTQG